jgi:hypothetical protein
MYIHIYTFGSPKKKKLIVQQEYFLGSEFWMIDLSFLMGAEFAANVGV